MGIDITRLSQSAQRQVLRKLREAANQKEKKTKYGNVKTTVDGIKFDSKKEAQRYRELVLEQKSGTIRNLRLQHVFTLQEPYTTPEGERIRGIRYIADFTYEEPLQDGVTWLFVVEDVKSKATRTAQYKLKKKLMREKLDIGIREV